MVDRGIERRGGAARERAKEGELLAEFGGVGCAWADDAVMGVSLYNGARDGVYVQHVKNGILQIES